MLRIQHFLLAFSLFALTLILSCKKDEGELKVNQAPETTFSIEEFNLSGSDRLNSIVRLAWYGSDPDGHIIGFELSQDKVNWFFTTKQDSTFQFTLNGGSDTTDIELYVRSIDNQKVKDPSPDYIKIPIKNTEPEIEFSDDLTIPDTTFLVATTEWSASDLDGEETITNVLISINGKEWHEISRTKKVISIVPVDPSTNDTTQARLYYGTEDNPASIILEGLSMNDTNKIYIKAIDQAGSESFVDTSKTFYMKGKKNDVLLVGGVESSASITPSEFYQKIFRKINVDFDLLDLLVNNGLYRPKLWNTTFRLQLSFYDKLFFFSDQSTYLNPYTGLSRMLLQFAAPSLQNYTNAGGKYMISSTFLHNQTVDDYFGVLPVQGKSTTNTNRAVLSKDSSLVSPLKDTIVVGNDTTVAWGNLKSSSFLLSNIGVYNIDPVDTEVLYRANVNKDFNSVWDDTKVIASGRRVNGNLNQIYFNIQLWRMEADYNHQSQDLFAVDLLFNQVFNVEFDK